MLLLTGSTGFTGRFVAEELIRRGIAFRCLVRDPQKAAWLAERGIPLVVGDVRDAGTYPKALEACDGIINLVSFAQDHLRVLIEQAHRARVSKAVFIGTTAIFTQLNAESKALRQRIEGEISTSGLDWTLLRPTMIYGAPGDRNMERLIRTVRRFFVHPILGRGDKLIQPVNVRDLASAIVDAFHCPGATQRAFNLSGKDALTYRRAVETVAELLGRRMIMIPLPVPVAIAAVEIARRLPGLPRLTKEQVLRLNEDKAFDHRDAAGAWGYAPMDFATGIRRELEDLGIPVHAT